MALPLTDELAAPAATLPSGVSLRQFAGEADMPAFVDIFRAANIADHIEERIAIEDVRNWLGYPSRSFDAARDLVVAAGPGNVPVAYGFTGWVDTSDGVREYSTRGHVHPEWRRQGVGTAILRHNEAHIRELAAEHEVETPRMYGAYAPERRPGAVALLEGNGYRPVRWFFDMLRPTLDDIDVPPLPQGLELRPVSGRDQMRQLFDADVEAFRDHWGGFDATDESFEQWLADPDYQGAILVVAWDRDEIAGAVVNVILEQENRELGIRRGLLDSVFVRRPWRGRGLAAALVGRSLQALRDRALDSATLGVDADNPNGALRLYEKAGFVVDVRSTGYRKPLEVIS